MSTPPKIPIVGTESLHSSAGNNGEAVSRRFYSSVNVPETPEAGKPAGTRQGAQKEDPFAHLHQTWTALTGIGQGGSDSAILVAALAAHDASAPSGSRAQLRQMVGVQQDSGKQSVQPAGANRQSVRPQKISILGTESSGKTVFLAAIAHALSSPAIFPHITAKNVLTVRYTAEVYDQLELGKWPKSTDVGVRQNLGWLWHARDQSKHELQTFDCAGQDFRTIFESEFDDELSAQQLVLKKEFYESDLILLLINLQRALDIYKVPGKNSERVNIEFAAAAAVRKLRKQGVTIYALFTQYDRCRERIERDWNGDISLALQSILPDLHAALVETGSAFAAIAAVETEPRDGELLPKVACQTGDLSAIVTGIDDFLVKNAPVIAQREQRRLAEEEKRKTNPMEERVDYEKSVSDGVVIRNSPTGRILNAPRLLPKSTPPPLPALPLLRNLFSIPALQSNASRADDAVSAIIWVLAMDAFLFCLEWLQYAVPQSSISGNNNAVKSIFLLGWPVLCIYSAIMFIRWFQRAYENVQLLSGETRYQTGWACYSWFIPFINLYRPFLIMREIFQKTNNLLNKFGEISKLKMATMQGWWLLWIVTHLLGLIIFNRNTHSYSPSAAQNLTIISMIYHIIDIPFGVLTIRLIKKHSKDENQIVSLKTA